MAWDRAGAWASKYLPYVLKITSPTAADIYRVPYMWVNTVTDDVWILVDVTLGVATWILINGPQATTILAVTATIAAGTNFSVTSSGVGYTKSGDDGDLQTSDVLFQAQERIMIFCNGVYQRKGTDATWQAQFTFQLATIQDNGDEIIILS